ncbi:MAG: ABC transporter permease subunit [Sphaerochaetaceae bacterium]|nr:ABC transporter permease subunit [Sphaerochaetaceae bacterium]
MQVFLRLVVLVQEPLYWKSIGFSTIRILVGLFLGIMGALGCSILSYSIKWFRILLSPLVSVIKSTPVASIVVVVLIYVSSRNLSIIISFLLVFPVVYSNLLQGFDSTPKELLEMAKIYRLSPKAKALAIFIPHLKPFFISACSTAMGFAWKSGIAAEVIGIPRGSIGERLYDAKIYFSTADIFAWTVTIIVLSSIFDKIFKVITKKVGGKL